MKKLTLISISLSLLFAFAGCSDSNNVLSTAPQLSFDEVENGRTLSKSGGPLTANVQMQPIGGMMQWKVLGSLTSEGNGHYSGSGTFEFPVLGGVVFIPILGVMQTEQNASGEVEIDLQAQGQQQGAGQVQLSLQGIGAWDPSTLTIVGLDSLRGTLTQPGGSQFDLDGPVSWSVGMVF